VVFSGYAGFTINKTDCHDITEILLKVALNTKTKLNQKKNTNECRRLHCSLKDLSSLLQALGRMAEHFIGENFPQRLSDGSMLLEK
jgi:hypothetical protein